jgi:hypothetical protein
MEDGARCRGCLAVFGPQRRSAALCLYSGALCVDLENSPYRSPLDTPPPARHLSPMSATLLRADLPVLFIPDKQPAKPRQNRLRVVSDYQPSGDQPTAITELVRGVEENERDQVLLSRIPSLAG